MPDDSRTSLTIGDHIWDAKYRLKSADGEPIDQTVDDTFARVAIAAAANEKGGRKVRDAWGQRYYDIIADLGFLPAGRILAGAGSGRAVTLFNCFVMGRISDDLGAIFGAVKEAALTMQQGGGVGMDFSTLRPRGAAVKSIGADASGPVSFMDVWDAMCRTIMSAGARRGAMMATLRCDHPDIETFIDAKSEPGRLRMFNVSVLVTDAFMVAVRDGAPWPLVFEGAVGRTVDARELWHRIMRATYDYAEPGVIFIDRVNGRNNLAYCEEIFATNPCGEQPLPPYGACLLGSINLARLIERPFTSTGDIDTAKLEARVETAVRFLDNVIDISGYPLPQQKREALAKRRMGLGVTGLADALIFRGLRYGSPEAVAQTHSWMGAIERAAYTSSARLAAEKGVYPLYDPEQVLARPKITSLDEPSRAAIAKSGLRNGCLTSVAPTGTISLFAGNVSSGIEPVFDFRYQRNVLGRDGTPVPHVIEDYAYARYRAQFGAETRLSSAFVTAQDLAPQDHLAMLAAAQDHVDSSISKTINCPVDISFDDFETIYATAYDLGLNGCTTYRPNRITGAVLTSVAADHIEHGVSLPAPAGQLEVPAVPPRDPVLEGFTYKLKWPANDHALYITINDSEIDGRRRPFEVFINTRNLEHYAWMVALTRMISAVFRRGGDVAFVAEELKAIFDPQGGRWMGGRYVPSLLAAIGEVIEGHMVRIGFLDSGAAPVLAELPQEIGVASDASAVGRAPSVTLCPRCQSDRYAKAEGCWTCGACGYSTCS